MFSRMSKEACLTSCVTLGKLLHLSLSLVLPPVCRRNCREGRNKRNCVAQTLPHIRLSTHFIVKSPHQGARVTSTTVRLN